MLDRIKNGQRAAGEGGFTLIELLVVIVILGILAGVVVFAVGGVGDRGQESACVIDKRTLRTAAEAHFARHRDYGATPTAWDGSGTAPRVPIDEQGYVTRGFLSEVSTYHDIAVYDSDSGTGVIPALDVTPVPGRGCT